MQPRALVVPYKLRRGVDTPHPLLLQLRKHLMGARLTAISQPPWERILQFHFESLEGAFTLVVELLGRSSNLILLDAEGTILESVKRVSLRLNRQRVILPGKPYQLPPLPAGRLAPIGEYDWQTLLAQRSANQTLPQWLSQQFLAVSPTLAREVEARLDTPQNPDPQQLSEAITQFFHSAAENQWQPSLGYDAADRLVAFAPYALRQCARSESAVSMNDAILNYLTSGQPVDAYARARAQVELRLKDAIDKAEHRAVQMRSQQINQTKIDRLRENGELLLTYQFLAQPGADTLEVTDYEGNTRSIPLNPRLKISDNAQSYFTRYEKAKRAAADMPARLAKVEAELAYLRQLESDLALASSRPQIDAVYTTLLEEGRIRKQNHSQPPNRSRQRQEIAPLRFEVEGWVIFAGRSARQNEHISFKLASPDDLWLHVHDQPGAHVVIKSGGKSVPSAVLQFAVQAAAYYSPLRAQGGKAQVDCTLRKFVHRLPGGHPGLVSYRESESFWVEDCALPPDPESSTGK